MLKKWENNEKEEIGLVTPAMIKGLMGKKYTGHINETTGLVFVIWMSHEIPLALAAH